MVKEIVRCRDMTDKPFGVNLDSGIKTVETRAATPAPHLPAFKAAGVKVVHKAAAVRRAPCAQGSGARCRHGQHRRFRVHRSSLRIIPVIASGGIADGAVLVAALALGASAVNMGTRFMATTEAPAHDNVKQQCVDNSERDTVIVFRAFHNSARVARNSVSEEIAEISQSPGASFEDVAHLASGARG